MRVSKIWLVTGASTGLGLEIVRAALQAGHRVAAVVLPQESHQLWAVLQDYNGLFIVETNIINAMESALAVKKAIAHFKGIDILVNLAEYSLIAAVEEATDAEVRLQYDTNVFGLLNMVREVLPFFRQQRSGHIINLSSIFAFEPIPGWGIYASTKLAIEGITKGLAMELASFNIKVTAIEPGLFCSETPNPEACQVTTNAIDDYNGTLIAHMREAKGFYLDNGRGDPKKIANVVLKLVAAARPPVLLPVGKDSLDSYCNQVKTMDAGIRKWEPLIRDTDFDAQTP